jgi:enoyl-CoA hydratase / 3-hydroxyacyl-CoA dehydrogenase
MESDDVIYEERGPSAWITMNRPHVLNALSKEMFRDLRRGLLKASKSGEVRFILLTGAGGSFSAGLDIKQVGEFSSKTEARNFVYRLVKPFWETLLNCDKPVLSVVDGHAYGAGAEIALASDIVIASEGSKFAFSGGRVGALCCISGVIGPSLMNGRKLVEMNLTGNPLSADEARAAGLVSHVVPQDRVIERTDNVLRDLARPSPISNASFKRIRKAEISKAALDVAYHELLRTITGPDFKKGSSAFATKTIPHY